MVGPGCPSGNTATVADLCRWSRLLLYVRASERTNRSSSIIVRYVWNIWSFSHTIFDRISNISDEQAISECCIVEVMDQQMISGCIYWAWTWQTIHIMVTLLKHSCLTMYDFMIIIIINDVDYSIKWTLMESFKPDWVLEYVPIKRLSATCLHV